MRRLLPALVCLALAAGGIWWLLPESDRPQLREIWHYATDPLYVVNAPVAYQLLGLAMGAADSALAERIELPEGYRIGVYARDLPHARVLSFTSAGHLLVSQPLKGRVTLLEPDRDADGRADAARVLLEDLRLPNGIALRDGWLYLAQPARISRARFDEQSGRLRGTLEPVLALPDTSSHNLRPLRFGPDGWLYTAIGTPCNTCVVDDPRLGAILRVRPEGGELEVVASGFRNVTDLAWHPRSGALHALDVGRDFAGDDFPPEELDRIVTGGFYGFPFLHGAGVPDPDLPPPDAELERGAVGPVHEFMAHSTPLGITFLPSEATGGSTTALVALHGSWNRTTPSGYALVSLRWRDDGTIAQADFATGFQSSGDVIGRPVQTAIGPDGAIYLSDDYAGAVYRIAKSTR